MNAKLLRELFANGENNIVDFKKEIYDINSNISEEYKLKQQASFIKDLISFSNTIRASSAYIIIGVEDKTLNIVGLNKEIDDNDFQLLVKDKLVPRPNFSYYSFTYKGQKLGIFEIPIQHLEEPVTYDPKKIV